MSCSTHTAVQKPASHLARKVPPAERWASKGAAPGLLAPVLLRCADLSCFCWSIAVVLVPTWSTLQPSLSQQQHGLSRAWSLETFNSWGFTYGIEQAAFTKEES